jgi:hypothetical protein
MVELARRFNLVTQATSFVVVDDRENAPRATRPTQFARTPLAMDETLDANMQHSVISFHRVGGDSSPTDRVQHSLKCVDLPDDLMHRLVGRRRSTDKPDAKNPIDVLRWQKADGSFEPCNELFEFIGLDDERTRKILDGRPDAARREATKQVLRWSHQLNADERNALAEAMRKASEWLKANAE